MRREPAQDGAQGAGWRGLHRLCLLFILFHVLSSFFFWCVVLGVKPKTFALSNIPALFLFLFFKFWDRVWLSLYVAQTVLKLDIFLPQSP